MTKDGGPAFPEFEHGTFRAKDGMSLRDYFAAAALPAVIAHMVRVQGIGDDTFWQNVSIHCGRGADAMLTEREKP